MSLIGPRPELVRYTNQYEGEEKDILKVRPGITDFSSVEFINLDEIVGGENADEMYEKYVLKKKNQLRMYDVNETPTALHISKRVLTLPMYADLKEEDVERICGIILEQKR